MLAFVHDTMTLKAAAKSFFGFSTWAVIRVFALLTTVVDCYDPNCECV